MKAAELKIDSETIELSEAWVHLKDAPRHEPAQYSLLVRGDYVVEVFDPGKNKQKNTPWETYIRGFLGEFGSGPLGQCLAVLKKIDKIEEREIRWVITSVEHVSTTAEGVVISGAAERFQRSQIPKPKPIR